MYDWRIITETYVQELVSDYYFIHKKDSKTQMFMFFINSKTNCNVYYTHMQYIFYSTCSTRNMSSRFLNETIYNHKKL